MQEGDSIYLIVPVANRGKPLLSQLVGGSSGRVSCTSAMRKTSRPLDSSVEEGSRPRLGLGIVPDSHPSCRRKLHRDRIRIVARRQESSYRHDTPFSHLSGREIIANHPDFMKSRWKIFGKLNARPNCGKGRSGWSFHPSAGGKSARR